MFSDQKNSYIGTTENTATEAANFHMHVSKKFLSEKDDRKRPLKRTDNKDSPPTRSSSRGKKQEGTRESPAVPSEGPVKLIMSVLDCAREEGGSGEDPADSPLVKAAAAVASETKQHRKMKEKHHSHKRLQRACSQELLAAASLASSLSRSASLSARDMSVLERERPSMGQEYATRLDVCEAAREGNMERLRELIDEGDGKKLLQLRDGSNMNALDHACAAGQLEVIRELILICGVDVNCANEADGYTALHHACSSGSLQVVTFLLLVANAHENPRGLDGFTPFDVAATKDIKKFLLSRRSMAGRASRGRSASVSMLSPMKPALDENPFHPALSVSLIPPAVMATVDAPPSVATTGAMMGVASRTVTAPASAISSAPAVKGSSPGATSPLCTAPSSRRSMGPERARITQVRGSMSRLSHSSEESESEDSSSSSNGEQKRMTTPTKDSRSHTSAAMGGAVGTTKSTLMNYKGKDWKTRMRMKSAPSISTNPGCDLVSWSQDAMDPHSDGDGHSSESEGESPGAHSHYPSATTTTRLQETLSL